MTSRATKDKILKKSWRAQKHRLRVKSLELSKIDGLEKLEVELADTIRQIRACKYDLSTNFKGNQMIENKVKSMEEAKIRLEKEVAELNIKAVEPNAEEIKNE